MFYLRKRSGRCNNLPKNLQVPGCTLMKQNTIVIMLHGWHAGTLLIFHSNNVTIVNVYTLTQKYFKVSPCLICDRLPTPDFI